MKDEKEILSEFFDTLYGEQEGYVYVAAKSASSVAMDWRQEWFTWPKERERLTKRILDQCGRADIYYGPSLYRTKNAVKDSILGSFFFWVDFDGNAPQPDLVHPKPTFIVQSSLDGHQHWYWKSEVFVTDISQLERVNRNLAYQFEGDNSGWDCTQVLRPPSTRNHKRGTGVSLTAWEGPVFQHHSHEFAEIAPEPVVIEEITEIPKASDVLAKYTLDGPTSVLFNKGANVGKRSMGLQALAHLLCQSGFSNEETLSLLIDADNRWGKFGNRKDQLKQLLAILSVARDKHPLDDSENPIQGALQRLQVFGFESLLTQENIQLEWVWDGFLVKEGFMLLTGAPKVGKTQFSLDFGISSVLGQQFLDRACTPGLKLAFLSLEMSAPELKLFMQQQSSSLTKEELALLEEKFLMIPVGEPYYLSEKKEQDDLEEMINDLHLDGIIIDSLGACVKGELTSEKEAKSVMDWNDRVRRRHNCFTWFIHHHRKASGDNKKPNKLDDIYGSYIFSARVTTALTLWNSGSTNSINLIPNAVRLAPTPPVTQVFRGTDLRFTTKKSGITIVKKGKEVESVHEEVSDEEFTAGFEY